MKPPLARIRRLLVPALALVALSAAVPPLARAGGGPPAPLDWKPCTQGQDDAVGKELDQAGARCAELTVPLDHSRPGGRTTIELALSRLPATDRDHRIGTMVLNRGGPGEPTLGMPLETRAAMKDVAARYDIVGLDPRFVGRSTPLDCGWPIGMWLRSAGETRARFDHQAGVQRDLAERCAQRHADVLPYANTRDTARDIRVLHRRHRHDLRGKQGHAPGADRFPPAHPARHHRPRDLRRVRHACVDTKVNAYLATGALPTTDPACRL